MSMKSSIILLIFMVLGIDGSHFLGGTISWRPLNASATGSPVDIVITQTYSWSFSIAACTSSMIATNQLVPLTGIYSVSSHRLNCSWNCATGAGGFTAQPVASYCTDFSAPAGTTVGQRSDIVRLNAGANFSASYQNIYWRNLTSGTNIPWAVSSYINLVPRSDNGRYNNAPVATVMSPIYIVKDQPTAIHIPVADADGDTLRCRWATSANGINECGGICPPSSLPNGTVIFPNCTMVITGSGVGNWFSVALTVEDFINGSSTTSMSSVPVQFLIQVVAPPTCNITPTIVGTPQKDSCMAIILGQSVTTELIAINSCGPTVNITDISTLSFPSVLKGNLTRWNSTTFSKSITWTPTSSQLGYQVMCAMAFNSQNAQSDQYCFTFYVSNIVGATCPGFTTNPPTTTTSTTTTTLNTTDVVVTSMPSVSEDSSSFETTVKMETTELTSVSVTSTTMQISSSTTTTINTTAAQSISTPMAIATTTKSTAANINWPLLGSLIGFFTLALCGLLGFLLGKMYHNHSKNDHGLVIDPDCRPVFYHIELCQDSDCQQDYVTQSMHFDSNVNHTDLDIMDTDFDHSLNATSYNTLLSYKTAPDRTNDTPKSILKRTQHATAPVLSASQVSFQYTSAAISSHQSDDDEKYLSNQERNGSFGKSVSITHISRTRSGAQSQNRLNSSKSTATEDGHIHVSRFRSGHNKILDIQSPKARQRAAQFSAATRAQCSPSHIHMKRIQSHIRTLTTHSSKTEPIEENNQLEDFSRIRSGVSVEHISKSQLMKLDNS